MTELKDQMVRLIGADSAKKAADFAGLLVHAKPAEKEQILAGLDFEKWLAGVCRECLN